MRLPPGLSSRNPPCPSQVSAASDIPSPFGPRVGGNLAREEWKGRPPIAAAPSVKAYRHSTEKLSTTVVTSPFGVTVT
jgi:hypothetical protein